jgi:hypothetical protein
MKIAQKEPFLLIRAGEKFRKNGDKGALNFVMA